MDFEILDFSYLLVFSQNSEILEFLGVFLLPLKYLFRSCFTATLRNPKTQKFDFNLLIGCRFHSPPFYFMNSRDFYDSTLCPLYGIIQTICKRVEQLFLVDLIDIFECLTSLFSWQFTNYPKVFWPLNWINHTAQKTSLIGGQ